MTQQIECVLYKHKVLSSNPQPVGMAECARNPSIMVVWNGIAGASCAPAKLQINTVSGEVQQSLKSRTLSILPEAPKASATLHVPPTHI